MVGLERTTAVEISCALLPISQALSLQYSILLKWLPYCIFKCGSDLLLPPPIPVASGQKTGHVSSVFPDFF